MESTKVYLVEYIWYDTYELLGVYNNEEAAIAHKHDENCIRQYGLADVHVTEVGVRSKKSLKEIHSRTIKEKGLI